MSKTSTPLLDAVKRQHAQDDGVDPYNTARMRAIAMVARTTEEQRKEAEEMLVGWDIELADHTNG